jgi:uncharacterized protein DUF6931
MAQRLRFSTAKDLFEAFPAALEDMDARPSERSSLEFVKDLAAGQTPEDAITFTAYLLGQREAVWWGHQCLSTLSEYLAPEDHQLLGLAENWVRQPDEGRRNIVMQAGMASPTKTPAVWIALAAGWSGGSMTGPDAIPVTPPPHLTAKAVNAGVLGVLARVDRGQRAPTLKAFVDMGIRLATRA